MIWSKIHCLSDYLNAPKQFGVYIIGIYTGKAPLPCKGTPNADKFLGQNYPQEFQARYIGRAYRIPIHTRLSMHFRGHGNSEVRNYLKTNGSKSLAFISITHEMPEIIEHMILDGTTLGSWNKQRSQFGAVRDWRKKSPRKWMIVANSSRN